MFIMCSCTTDFLHSSIYEKVGKRTADGHKGAEDCMGICTHRTLK